MKKILLSLIIAAMLASLASCADKADKSDSSKADDKPKTETSVDVSTDSSEDDASGVSEGEFAEFKSKILEKVAFEGEMVDNAELDDYPMNAHGIAKETYSDHIYYEVSDTTNSYETIIVFKAKSEDNVTEIKEKLDAYISSLKAQFGNYNATIIDMVNKSVVATKGQYVYLVISPNVDAIETLICDNIG